MCSSTEACVLAFMHILAFISRGFCLGACPGLPGFASHRSSLHVGAGCQ